MSIALRTPVDCERDRRPGVSSSYSISTRAAMQPLAILVREQQDRLGHVAHVALDEKGLILLDEIARCCGRERRG